MQRRVALVIGEGNDEDKPSGLPPLKSFVIHYFGSRRIISSIGRSLFSEFISEVHHTNRLLSISFNRLQTTSDHLKQRTVLK